MNDPTLNQPALVVEPHNPVDEVSERERAIQLLELLPTIKEYTIRCRYTGVPTIKMFMPMQVGKLPYLDNWNDALVAHPLFSLTQRQLLSWTRKQWNLLFKDTADRTTPEQRQQFQIAFVAILKSLNSVKLEAPVLPSFDTVNTNMQRLLELAYWYNWLDSQRFRFPTLRVNKTNNNLALQDIGTYFSICNSAREDWERSKEAALDEEKIEAARRAEKSVRGSHVRAISKKMLWNWFISCIATGANKKRMEYPEWKEWKADSEKLWFGSENQQLSFSLDDVDSIEDVFLTEAELGSTVSNAFKRELHAIREHIRTHIETFTIDLWTTTSNSNLARVDKDGNRIVSGEQQVPEHPGAEPQIGNFPSRADYIKANAKWTIKMMQWKAWTAAHPVTSNKDEGTES